MEINTDESPVEHGERSQRQYAVQKLAMLRIELHRLAHDVRMKSVGAGTEDQNQARALDRDVRQFAARMSAGEDGRDALIAAGEQLHRRLRRLANQIAMAFH